MCTETWLSRFHTNLFFLNIIDHPTRWFQGHKVNMWHSDQIPKANLLTLVLYTTKMQHIGSSLIILLLLFLQWDSFVWMLHISVHHSQKCLGSNSLTNKCLPINHQLLSFLLQEVLNKLINTCFWYYRQGDYKNKENTPKNTEKFFILIVCIDSQ